MSTHLWWRSSVRHFKTQPAAVRALAGASAVLLVATTVTAAMKAGDDGDGGERTTSVAAGVPEAGGGQGTGDGGAGPAGGPTPGAPAPNGTEAGAPPALGGGPPLAPATGGGGPSVAGSGPGGGAPTPGGVPGPASPGATPTTAPKAALTASDRGVTPDSIKVVFPWFNIDQASAITGSTTEEPLESATNAIRAYVDHHNKNGGIGGRKIAAQIEEFNPINEADMRQRCIRWADDNKVFAVVDSEAWHSAHQLCLTQEKQTPLISSFTTVNEWTRRGKPYLWWTGPSTEDSVDNWVLWATERKVIADDRVGVLVSDRAEDKITTDVMKAAFKKVNVTAQFEVIPFDNAAAQPAAFQAVQRMKGKVDQVFILLPFTTMKFWLTQADAQEFFPKYLMSDIQQTLVVSEALLGAQHAKALNGAIGPTYAHLGEKTGAYDKNEKFCNDIWKAAYPKAEDIDKAGVAMRWCQNIAVFVEGARRATAANNGVLTRVNFGAAMATIKDLPGSMTKNLSFGPSDAAGATHMKVVEVRTDGQGCAGYDTDDTCHLTKEDYAPLRRFA